MPLTARHPVDAQQLPIGVTTELEERADAAWGAWRVSKTALGDEVLELARDGVPLGLSVGFMEVAGGSRWSADRKRVTRTRAALDHVAIVRVPAYAGAAVQGVRAAHGPALAYPLATLARRHAVASKATQRRRAAERGPEAAASAATAPSSTATAAHLRPAGTHQGSQAPAHDGDPAPRLPGLRPAGAWRVALPTVQAPSANGPRPHAGQSASGTTRPGDGVRPWPTTAPAWATGAPGTQSGPAGPAHPTADLTADHEAMVGLGHPEGGPLVVRCRSCNSARAAAIMARGGRFPP